MLSNLQGYYDEFKVREGREGDRGALAVLYAWSAQTLRFYCCHNLRLQTKLLTRPRSKDTQHTGLVLNLSTSTLKQAYKSITCTK